eukprot:g3266.t1
MLCGGVQLVLVWIAKEKGQLQRESVPTYLSAEPLEVKTHPEDLQDEKLYRLELQMCPGSRTATLHGLWPLWNNNELCEGPPFIEGVSQIRDLLPELVSMWPSCQPHAREFGRRDSRGTSLLERGTTSKVTTLEQGIQAYQWFWRYEYNKHGKCAVEELFRFVPEKRYTEGVHAYFEKSLELAKNRPATWLAGRLLTMSGAAKWSGRVQVPRIRPARYRAHLEPAALPRTHDTVRAAEFATE